MLVLPMAAAGSRQPPSIVRKKPNQFPDLHALPSIILLAVQRTDQPPQRAKRAAVGCIRKFDARRCLALEQPDERIAFDLAVAKDCREESRGR